MHGRGSQGGYRAHNMQGMQAVGGASRHKCTGKDYCGRAIAARPKHKSNESA